MSESEKVLDAMAHWAMDKGNEQLNEPLLEDDYPVHAGFLYVCDGEVAESPLRGTVAEMKVALQCNEVRRCDMKGRGMFGGGQ